MQELLELRYHVIGSVLPRLLPDPSAVFPNLRRLDADATADTHNPVAWVAGLGRLSRLEALRLW